MEIRLQVFCMSSKNYFCSMLRISIFLISIILWSSCKKPYVGNTYVPPSIALNFSECASPPSPDYSNNEHWAALPFRKDMADSVPNSSVSDGQATAAVDVFFSASHFVFGVCRQKEISLECRCERS